VDVKTNEADSILDVAKQLVKLQGMSKHYPVAALRSRLGYGREINA
jgi:hypothetical protein